MFIDRFSRLFDHVVHIGAANTTRLFVIRYENRQKVGIILLMPVFHMLYPGLQSLVTVKYTL